MLYSVSNWIYDLGREPLETTFKRLRRFGFDGVELIGEPQQYDAAHVRDLCRQHQLPVLSVLGWCVAPTEARDFAHPSARIRDQSIAYARRLVDLAVAVGAPLVALLPAPAGRTAPVGPGTSDETWQAEYELEWQNAVHAVRSAAAYAEAHDVILAIEPVNRYESFLVNTAAQAARFIHEVGSPAVKLHLDTFHMNIEEKNPAEAVRRAGGLLVNLHVSDSTHGPVGSGHVDFRAVMRALADIRYDGPLTLESTPPHPDRFIAARADRFLASRDQFAEESIRRLKHFELERLMPALHAA